MRLFLKILAALFALIGVLITALFIYSTYYFHSDKLCKSEYTYNLKGLDPRHNLSDGEVIAIMQEAELQFESKIGGRNILRYSDTAADIHFEVTFDESLNKIATAAATHDEYFGRLEKEVADYTQEIGELKISHQTALDEFNRVNKEYQEMNVAFNELSTKYSNGEVTAEIYTKEHDSLKKKNEEVIAAGNRVNELTAKATEVAAIANQKIDERNSVNDAAIRANEQLEKADMISNLNYQPGPDLLGGYEIGVEYFADKDELRNLIITAFSTVLVDDDSRIGEHSKRFNTSPSLFQKIAGVEAKDELYLLRVCR